MRFVRRRAGRCVLQLVMLLALTLFGCVYAANTCGALLLPLS